MVANKSFYSRNVHLKNNLKASQSGWLQNIELWERIYIGMHPQLINYNDDDDS
jgi:hypothetical protein